MTVLHSSADIQRVTIRRTLLTLGPSCVADMLVPPCAEAVTAWASAAGAAKHGVAVAQLQRLQLLQVTNTGAATDRFHRFACRLAAVPMPLPSALPDSSRAILRCWGLLHTLAGQTLARVNKEQGHCFGCFAALPPAVPSCERRVMHTLERGVSGPCFNHISRQKEKNATD